MRESNWDQFWVRSKGGRFTRVSWSKIRMEAILAPHLFPGARVLDAGCGSGYFSALFQSKGCRVTTLDASEEALEIARGATDGKSEAYLREDLLDESFEERYRDRFDLAFTDGLFEHFRSDEQARIMNNLSGAIRPGGLIATFVPNALSWWTVIRPIFMPGIYEKPFRRSSLLDLHGGLEIVERGGLSVLPFRLSPERALGARFGMLIYVLARKGNGPS